YDSDAAAKPEVHWAEWRLAEALTAEGADVRVVRLPPGAPGPDGEPVKVGLDDFLFANSPAALRRLLEQAGPPTRPKREEGQRGERPVAKRTSQATRLVAYAAEALEFFHSPERDGFATSKKSPRCTWPLRSRQARQLLAKVFFDREGMVPSGEAIQA